MHTHTQLHRLHQLWPVLLVALLAIVSPAQGQWYLESTIDTSGLDLSSGMSLATNGDTVVVGGLTDAYIFERTTGQWSQTKSLNLLSGATAMPVQVAIDGDNVAVSAAYSATSYVLHRDAPGVWSSSTLAARGFDVDISGNTVLLCDKRDWGGVGARVFDRQTDGSWALSTALPVMPGMVGFGAAGAISGNRAIVTDSSDRKSYVFERDAAGTWSSTATLTVGSPMGLAEGVGLSGSAAVIGGFPGGLLEKAQSGEWTKVSVPYTSPSYPVAVDGNDAFVSGFAHRRDAAGAWTESQALPGLGVVAQGGGKLASWTANNQIRIYSYDSSPRLLYSNFSDGTILADLGFTVHGDPGGSAQIKYDHLALIPRRFATMETIGVSRMLDCQDQVTFTFEYTVNTYAAGSSVLLQLSLNGVLLDTFSSSQLTGTPYRRTFNLAELGLSPGELRWDLDCIGTGISQATIDNLYITTNVPEPATLALLAAGGLAMQRRRRR